MRTHGDKRATVTYLMVSVREVETRHVHAGVEHFDEHFDIPACWTKGANDFGLPRVWIDALKDVLEFDTA